MPPTSKSKKIFLQGSLRVLVLLKSEIQKKEQKMHMWSPRNHKRHNFVNYSFVPQEFFSSKMSIHKKINE